MRSLKNERLQSLLKAIFGVILLVLVFQAIDIPSLVVAVSHVDLRFFLLAVFMYLATNLILSFRLFKCLNFTGHTISWIETFWSHLFGMLWSNITPGRAGYVFLTYQLYKRKGIPVPESLSCLGTIESIELIVKAVAAATGLFFLVSYTSNSTLVFFGSVGILAILSMSSTFLALCWTDVKILNRIVKGFPFLGEKALELVERFKSSSQALKSKALLIAFMSATSWLIRGLEWTFIGYSCQISLTYLVFLMLHPLLTAVRYIPLTPAGIGVFEGITLLGFSVFGVPPERAFLFSLFDRVDNVVIDILAIKEMKGL